MAIIYLVWCIARAAGGNTEIRHDNIEGDGEALNGRERDDESIAHCSVRRMREKRRWVIFRKEASGSRKKNKQDCLPRSEDALQLTGPHLFLFI